MTQVLDREGIETIPTARDDEFCHVAIDPLAGPPWEAVCGAMVKAEPACCNPPYDKPCGRPECPECRVALRRKAR